MGSHCFIQLIHAILSCIQVSHIPPTNTVASQGHVHVYRSYLGSTFSHCLQVPYQCLLTHFFRRAVGKLVGDGVAKAVVGDGSTHMSPNHSLDVQSSVSVDVADVADATEEVGLGVADVVVVVSS